MRKKALFLIATIFLVLTLSLISASSFNIHKVKYQTKIDKRTSGEKYYPAQAVDDNPSLWRNKQVFNKPRVLRNESYGDKYYYTPRYDTINDHFQWRF